MAAASIPRANVDRLNAALVQVVRAPEIRARLIELGAEIMTSSARETSDFITQDRKRWASVLQRAGNQVEGIK